MRHCTRASAVQRCSEPALLLRSALPTKGAFSRSVSHPALPFWARWGLLDPFGHWILIPNGCTCKATCDTVFYMLKKGKIKTWSALAHFTPFFTTKAHSHTWEQIPTSTAPPPLECPCTWQTRLLLTRSPCTQSARRISSPYIQLGCAPSHQPHGSSTLATADDRLVPSSAS